MSEFVLELERRIEMMASVARLGTMLAGCSITQIVYVSVKLGIPDLLASDPQTVDELANRTGAHAPSLARIVRALVHLGVLVRHEDGRFGLTIMGERLTSGPGGASRSFALTMGEELYRAYDGLLHTVMTGEPAFEHIFGMSYYEYLAQHRDAAEHFGEWMTRSMPESIAPALLACDMRDASSVVDVGGAGGALLALLLQANPAMHGILFDLPHALSDASHILTEAGVADRVEIMTGSFLEFVPPGGAIYILARILLNWDDAHVLTILRNCRRAMGSGAKLLIVDAVPSAEHDAFAIVNDVNLMVLFPQGHQRSETELQHLLQVAGFTVSRIARRASTPDLAVIEAVPLEESATA